MGEALSSLFVFVVVVAAAFVVLTLTASFVRFHMLAQRIEQADPEDVAPEDVFQLRIVQELGALHQAPDPFTIMLLEPDVPPEFEAQHGPDAMDRWMDAFVDAVKKLLRADDGVYRFKGRQCGVLGRFPHGRAEAVVRRIAHALAQTSITTDSGMAVRWPVYIGVVSHPEHGGRALNLLEQAGNALAEARRNVKDRYHIAPAPEPAPEERPAPTKSTAKRDAQLHALLDEVTGVLRAERFGTALQKFLARHRKEGEAVSVLYLSIDNFHQYRDHYAGDAANALLKGVADLLSDHTRETDVLARVTESDFAVAMDCAPAHALKAAQRLSAGIKKIPFRVGSRANLRVTVSIGVAGYPDHTGQAGDMWAYAEAAMHAARARGRSVTLMYQPEMAPQRREEGPVDAF